MNTFIIALSIWNVLTGSLPYEPNYGVKVARDKKTDFARLRTYTWTTGWMAYDEVVDRQMVTAVDRELAASGFTKVAGQPPDVVVRYASLQRTDVDLKSKVPGTQLHREYPVGTLIVFLLEPRSMRELFRARVDMPLVTDRSRLPAQIDGAVARMFAKYPTHRRGYR